MSRRLHRTLKQEVAMPPAPDRRAQQRELDRFRQEYNQVRPHEALGIQTPASVYVPSAREYPRRLPEVEYPSSMLVRGVKSHGVFRWKKHDVFLSEVLWGERIGLLPRDGRWFTIYFAQLPLAEFDSQQGRVAPLRKPPGFEMDGAGEGEAPLFLHFIPRKPAESVRHVPDLNCQACARPYS